MCNLCGVTELTEEAALLQNGDVHSCQKDTQQPLSDVFISLGRKKGQSGDETGSALCRWVH